MHVRGVGIRLRKDQPAILGIRIELLKELLDGVSVWLRLAYGRDAWGQIAKIVIVRHNEISCYRRMRTGFEARSEYSVTGVALLAFKFVPTNLARR